MIAKGTVLRRDFNPDAAFRRAARIIRELGSGSVDDVMPRMPDMSRKQVMKALDNASHHGLLRATGGRPSGLKKHGPGKRPGMYYPADSEEPLVDDDDLWKPILPEGPQVAYPSVFHYGQGESVTLTWRQA